MKYKYRNIFLKQRCITSTSQSTQVHTRPHARIHTIKLVPTQHWLFLLAQTINCHSLELAILNRIFLEYIPFAQAFKRSNTFFQRFFFFTPSCLGAYWLHACRREIEMPFSSQLDVTDTCPILISGQPMPRQKPLWRITAQGGTRLHEKSTFPNASLGTA